MRLVMGAESLLGPLSGIGQYTYQLAQQMASRDEIEELRFLAHGRLLNFDAIRAIVESEDGAGINGIEARNSVFNRVRTVAAQNVAIVKVYQSLFPLVERWAMRDYEKKDVLHSPNYLLPPFKGRKVVSILDLSTVRFPQFHPRARVTMVNDSLKRVAREADHIITISDFIKQEIIEHFQLAPERISTTHLGVDDSFRPYDRAAFTAAMTALQPPPEYKAYFLFISTIEPRKNLDRLLDAHQLYTAEAGDAALPLVVTGLPGWKSDDTHRRLQQLQDSGSVRYLGFVHQHLIPPLMAGARALLYPSLYEGFGLPSAEAMKSGTAIMISADSAMSEVAGDAGALVDPNDTEMMAATITRLADDDAWLGHLESLGLQRIGHFSWEKCAEETLATYLGRLA